MRVLFFLFLFLACKSSLWAQDLLITDFGAISHPELVQTAVIQAALDSASRRGGARVVIPAGTFVSGTLRLSEGAHLYLASGATLYGSRLLEDYDREHPHLIFATGNAITLAGLGTIDGNGEAFFDRQGHTGERSTRSWRALARPQPWLEFSDCRRLKIQDLNFINSPSHVISLSDCRQVVIDGISIENDARSPNTDGIDVRDSRNVMITNCRIVTGDDAICLKSKRDTVENILVNNCYLSSDDAGIKFGTGTEVMIRHCNFTNLIIDNTRYGIALFMLGGGINEHCRFSNLTIRNGSRHPAEYPIFADIDLRTSEHSLGRSRHMTFSNIDIFTSSKLLLAGQPSHPLENFTLRDINIFTKDCRDQQELDRKPKGNKSFVPIEGLVDYAAENATITLGHHRGLKLDNVRLYNKCGEERQALWTIDCEGDLDGLTVQDQK